LLRLWLAIKIYFLAPLTSLQATKKLPAKKQFFIALQKHSKKGSAVNDLIKKRAGSFSTDHKETYNFFFSTEKIN